MSLSPAYSNMAPLNSLSPGLQQIFAAPPLIPAGALPPLLSQSPVHDFVRAFPQATVAQVVQATGAHPTIAQQAINDVASERRSAALTPPQMLQNAIGVPSSFPAASPALTPNNLLTGAIGGPQPPQNMIRTGVSAPLPATASAAITAPNNPAAPLGAGPNLLDFSSLSPALRNTQDAVAAGMAQAPQKSAAITQKGHPNTLTAIAEFAPLALALLGARRNPGAAAAFLGGDEAGIARQAQLRLQQQQLANQQAQTKEEDAIRLAEAQSLAGYRQGELANASTRIGQAGARILNSAQKDAEGDIFKQPSAKAALGLYDQQFPNDELGWHAELANAQDDKNPLWTGGAMTASEAANAGNAASRTAAQIQSDQAANRAKLFAETPATQQALHDASAGAPKHWEDTYGIPYASFKAGMSDADALAASRNTETVRHNRVMEALGGEHVQIDWQNAHTQQFNADSRDMYRQWVENGGKTANQASKSIYNNPWGKVYDEAVAAQDKALAQLQADLYPTSGGTTNPNIIAQDRAILARISAQVDRMQKTAPPTGKQTLRSTTWSGKTIPGVDTTNPMVKAALSVVGKSCGPDGCATTVSHIGKSLGLSLPTSPNAATFERQLPQHGYGRVDGPAQPGDIVAMPGKGPSGRHVGFAIGGGRMVNDPGKSSGYKARIDMIPAAAIVYRKGAAAQVASDPWAGMTEARYNSLSPAEQKQYRQHLIDMGIAK